MTPDELSLALTRALQQAVAEQAIPLEPEDIPELVRVERPKNRDHGDWATNIAMQLAKRAGRAPRELAERLQQYFSQVAGVDRVDIAGPGFMNITVSASAAGALAKNIVEAGTQYGRSDLLAQKNYNLEFVSANPTGPIHLGGTRWAAMGDSLARILQSQGATVGREYYFNDHGAQIDRFAASLMAAAKGEDAPEDGYQGEYIDQISAAVLHEHPGLLEQDPAEALEIFRSTGVQIMFAQIKDSLAEFRVQFDLYFHEDSLHTSGAVAQQVQALKESGQLYEKEGAWWLKTTEFGDDKDRVVIKSDGKPAYIAGDIAYLADKSGRGFTDLIYMLGADHHGYIARLKASAAAVGIDPRRVEVIIGQMVNLVKEGKPVRMSKRAGTIVTMEDLVEAVGVDAARYALVRYSPDSNIDIDLDLLTKHNNENPVFYVQYAHARTQQVARNAAASGVSTETFDAALLDDPSESGLLAALGAYPSVLAQAAEFREPHRVVRHLEAIASAYHKWYDIRRVTPLASQEAGPEHNTRLWLNNATAQVLANGLELVGVSAPERM